MRLGSMHRALEHAYDRAAASYEAAWRVSPFAIEAARALIDLGGHTAEDLLAMCPGVHATCAPWIPTLIQAYSYERRYAPREALKCLESLGAAFDTSLDCLLQKARLRLHLIDLGAAIQLYERAHRLDEHNCADMDLYAMCLFERRGPSDAAKLNALAQQLTKSAEGHRGHHDGIGRPEPWIAAALHALMRADGRADALADQAILAGPRHANAHFVKGMVMIANDNAGGSLQYFRKARKLDPSIRTYTGLVHAYIADGQHVMALATAKEVQKMMPSEAQPMVLLGTVYSAQFQSMSNVGAGTRGGAGSREAKRAKLAFERALKLDPACEVATHQLADTLFATSDNAGAAEVLKSALRHNESARLHARLGQALSAMAAGGTNGSNVVHFHEAAEHFQHALQLIQGMVMLCVGKKGLESLMKGDDPDKSMDQDYEEEY